MIRSILLGTGILLPVFALATSPSAAVVDTSPQGWSASAPSNAVLTVTLDAPPAGVTNFSVYSAWRGKQAGAVDGSDVQSTFTPAALLLPGEPVESTLSDAAGMAFSWRFQAAPLGGGASFMTSAVTTVMDTLGAVRFRNIALADINGDSLLDIVAPAWSSNAVLIATAPSWASTKTTRARGIQDVAVADFNADGRPDLLLGCSTQAFAVALNTGSGYAAGSAVQTVSGVTGPLRQVAVGDLDRNGSPDGVAISEISGHVIPLLNNGAGVLMPGTAVPCIPSLYGLDVGDLDRDGIPDIVTVGSAGYLAILKGNGNGTFQAPDEHKVSDEILYACRIADFNQDGYADIAAVGAGGVVVVGTGSASNFTFAAIDHGYTLTTLYGLAVGDCDANGLPDIVACGGPSVLVLLAGPGGFSASRPPVVLPSELLRDVEIGDLNNDGCLDLVACGLTSGKTYVLWNAPAPRPLIRGNGQDIRTGEPANIEKGTDFGAVPLFSTVTNHFQLINQGRGVLLVDDPVLSGASTSVLKLVNMPASVLPGATSAFDIVFAPTVTGAVNAVLTIANNSPSSVSNAASPYILNLAGWTIRSRPIVLALEETNQVYDGSEKSVIVTSLPLTSVSVVYDGGITPPVTAGVYTVVATMDTELYYGTVTSLLTVAKRPLSATCGSGSRAYGETNPVFSIALSNFIAGEGETNLITMPVAVSAATAGDPVGPYPVVASGGDAANYGFVSVNGTLTVTQTLLTARADSKTRLINEANPPFTISYSGWKNSDSTNVFTVQPVAATTATNGCPTGVYPITVSGGSATNYAFYYISGTFTVYGVTAAVTITDIDFVYDGTMKTVTVSTVPAGLPVTVTYNGLSIEPVTAGVYSVLAEVTSPDYSGSTNATMTIRKAAQNMTSFLPPGGVYPADQLLTLSGSGSPSGIPVSFEVRSGPAMMASSNQLRFLGAEPVVVAAWQPADANWNASPALTNEYAALETNRVHYAAMAGQTPYWPYATWETAASNIQVAVDLAASGEAVLVGAGTYDQGGRAAPGQALANRLVLGKPVTVLAVAGPRVTVLAGGKGSGPEAPLGPDALRCAFLADGALLAGFTLTNGFTDGEVAPLPEQAGGGAFLSAGGVLSNCVISGCGAVSGGGFKGGSAARCALAGNQARYEGGGAAEASLSACLLWNNAAPYGGGAFRCESAACTLADNAALYGGGTYEGSLVNSIAWYNTGWDAFGTDVAYVNAGSGIAAGVDGCLSVSPLFADRARGNYHLAYGSPCINAGDNGASPVGSLDLDGALRPIHASVDMGAYEFFGTPGVPLLPSVSDVRAHQASLGWQQPADDVRVILFRVAVSNLDVAGPETTKRVDAPALSNVLTGMAPGTAYACRIRAENDYDIGGWSGWQSFTTLTEAVIARGASLTFNTAYAAGGALTQTGLLANPGATPCVWSGEVAYDGPASGWLSVSPADGTVEPFGSTNLRFVVNAAGLNAGTYTARHTVSSPNATNSPQVQDVTLHVARAADTITFGATNQVYNGESRPVTVSTFSGEPAVVTYNGSTEPPVNAGVYAVTGVIDTLNWTAVQSTRLTVAPAPQSIMAFLPASGDMPSTNVLALSANGGGSGNPVMFAVLSGPAALLPGNRVRFSDYGEVRVIAGQAGNANWLPAPTRTNVYRVVPIPAFTHHVAQAGQSPVWPYANWAEAASNIQDGVDAAWDGDFVAVTNGLYRDGGRVAPGGEIASRVCVTRPIELYSVNGPGLTVVAGARPVTVPGLDAVRALYAGTHAVIRGFTFTDGHTAFDSELAQDRSGGGVYLTGGAELRQCLVAGNGAAEYGGGVFVRENGRVINSLIVQNEAGRGAGLCLYGGGEANHCTIASNTASIAAGGVYVPAGGDLCNSIVWGNRAPLPAAQDILNASGVITYTDAGDGVVAGIAGCLSADPLFVPGGYRPEAVSPCVDAGNNARVIAATDYKNDARVVATVDMGAYEYLTKPAVPKEAALTGLTDESVTLNWQPGDVMPVTTYGLDVELIGDANVLSEALPGSATSLVVTGLSQGMGYRWRVRAENSLGSSDWTPWQNFFTSGLIQEVTPSSCNIGGGLEVLVEGLGLGYDSNIVSVSLCDVPAEILDQGRNWVRVMAPMAAVPGVGHVRVSSPTGGDMVLSNAFEFLAASAPVLLPPTDFTDTSLMARWESLAGAGSYQLQVSASPDFAACLPGYSPTSAPVAAVSEEVQGLVPGTNYMRLRAFFAQGYGPFSAVFAVPSGAEQPWVRNPIANRVIVAGTAPSVDLMTVFGGSGLIFTALSSQPSMVAPSVSGNTLTLPAGPELGMVTVTVAAVQSVSGYGVSIVFTLDVIPAPMSPVRVNCGGAKSDDWLRDRGFSGGTTLSTLSPIAYDPKYFTMGVYQDCRVASNLTYTLPSLPNGTYNVRLAFAELAFDRAGARVFRVRIEGVTVMPWLDVFAMAGGRYRAFQPQFKVVVSDGNGMQIRGTGINGSEAFFSGITIAPTTPSGMLSIPGGVNAGIDPDKGPYAVTNRAKLYVDDTEVTKQQWDAVRVWGLEHGYADLPEGGGKATNHPVQNVSWYDCAKWCNARSEMQGLPPAYFTTPAKAVVYRIGQIDMEPGCVDAWAGYRLPTEAEWEYAARGGLSGQRFPWGDTIGHGDANYFSDSTFGYDVSGTSGYHPLGDDGIAPYTCAVGLFSAYGYKKGLHDMAGNVAEWCWDGDPEAVPNRFVRGGAWFTDASWCRVAQHMTSAPDVRSDAVGFRAVMFRP